MTGSGHDHFQDLTAAYVVGALEADERAEIEDHLRTCDRCRQDVVAFAPLPALLGRLEEADLETGGQVAGDRHAVVEAVRSDIARLDRSRRRWRRSAGAAAAAVLVLFAVMLTDGDDESRRRSGGIELQVQTASAEGSARVVADERAWGTYVHISAEDLPERESYALWVVDESGIWEPAGSWARTPDGAADLGGSSQRTLEQIDRIVVTSVDRTDEILVAR